MNGRLVPQKRPDKNGKMVTRHVVGEAAAPATKQIPAPDLGFALSNTYTTIPKDPTSLNDLWKVNVISTTDASVEQIDPRAVREIDRLLATSDRKFSLSDSIQEALNHMSDSSDPIDVHNVAVFGKHTVPHGMNGNLRSYIDGLSRLGMYDGDYLLKASDKDREAAIAVVSFIVQAEHFTAPDQFVEYGRWNDSTYLKDEELGAFIRDNPDMVDEVVSVLSNSKQALSVELIKERMAHSEKAFRDGVL